MDKYQQYIHVSKYARFIDELGRRETWAETVQRYINFFGDRFNLDPDDRAALYDGIYQMKAMPSMRAMMTAGPALIKDNAAAFNCCAFGLDNPRCFDEAFYLLMCGCGVGFSVARNYTKKMPEINDEMFETDTVIVVADSKIGWARALKELIAMLYTGNIPKWDLSKIRPAGARLKTFGGRASGPLPLDRLFKYTVRVFKNATGRRLTSIECHDLMCQIAKTVIVGSVRRSAMISFSNLSDDRMRRAKTGDWYPTNPERALANNSVMYTCKPDLISFITEFQSMYVSKAGERGMCNQEALQAKAKACGREYDGNYLLNPCFTGDMRLKTEHGYLPFESLVGKDVNIIDSSQNVVPSTVWCSGIKDTIKLVMSKGNPITCTPDHVYKITTGEELEAKDLKGYRLMPDFSVKHEWKGEEFLAGFIQGDGSTGRLKQSSHNGMEVDFGEKDGDIADMFGENIGTIRSRLFYDIAEKYQLSSDPLPSRKMPDEVSLDFLAGLYSANGCVISGHRIAFKSTCRQLIDQIADKLQKYDIKSYVTTNKPSTIKWPNGTYTSKESYDLNINNFYSILKFAELISFGQSYKREKMRDLILDKSPLVRCIKSNGLQPVYDFTSPVTHWGFVEGFQVHNCGESILRDNGSMCNLSESVARPEDTLDDLKDKVRLATIFGTMQSTLTDFRYLRKIWQTNAIEDPLLGVSITGVMDHPILCGYDEYKATGKFVMASEWLAELKQVAKEVNQEWAKKLGCKPATQISLVKPSGTVSQLVNCSSGMHPRFSPFFLRKVAQDIKDPLSQMMIDQGIPHYQDGDKYYFEFPIAAPIEAICIKDVDPIYQLELWKVYQSVWCDGNPSQTIYYDDNSFLGVQEWVYRNWDTIGGLSFFPHDDNIHPNSPYTEISEEQYNKLVSEFPVDIDFTRLGQYETEDCTTSMKEISCGGGACEL